jgi:hypothetical protein
MHPFAASFPDQLAALRTNLAQLEEYATQHPLPDPWAVSPLGPSCYYPSTAKDAVIGILGASGWTEENTIIWKDVDGIRIEIRLNRSESRPYVSSSDRGAAFPSQP